MLNCELLWIVHDLIVKTDYLEVYNFQYSCFYLLGLMKLLFHFKHRCGATIFWCKNRGRCSYSGFCEENDRWMISRMRSAYINGMCSKCDSQFYECGSNIIPIIASF